eukprot:gene11029-11111_t
MGHKYSTGSILKAITARASEANDPRLVVTFPIQVPANFTQDEVKGFLDQQGYTRIHADLATVNPVAPPTSTKTKKSTKKAATVSLRTLLVVQDRFRLSNADPSRVMEALDIALKMGNGLMAVHAVDDDGQDLHHWKFSDKLHCADCSISYSDPLPSTFSFNSPLGACEACRGFGRVIGIDFGLVIPDENKTLEGGAIKPFQTPTYKECQDEMAKYAARANVSMNTPWKHLPPEHQDWVLLGDPAWVGGNQAWKSQWYGVQRFFGYLESKSYKMHLHALPKLSRCTPES